MKMVILLLSVLSLALAEPPISDSYTAALRSSHDHSSEYQRSLSQEYGAPSARNSAVSFNTLSNEYLPPTARNNAPSQEYGVPGFRSGIPQTYGAPNLRSGLSQEYGAPGARNTNLDGYESPLARLSQEYGTPNSIGNSYSSAGLRNGISQQYGAPGLRSSPSSTYGAPSQRSLSSLYSAPEFRSTPSEQYGVPSQRSFAPQTRGVSAVQKYGVPKFQRNQFNANSISQDYGVSSERSNSPQSYSAASNFKSSFGARSRSQALGRGNLSPTYGAPEARNAASFSHGVEPLSTTYGAPSARSGSLSQEYGVPARSTDLKSHNYQSSYAAARSSPSQEYGPPSARSMPSQQYGVPSQYDSLSDQGYGYARNALNELLNQEPANYDFAYAVNDYASGSDFGHTETRQEDRAEGAYFVVLPDGTKQVVEYEADERGFKPRISVEPADDALDTRAQGPY